jgi:hypothetical protein
MPVWNRTGASAEPSSGTLCDVLLLRSLSVIQGSSLAAAFRELIVAREQSQGYVHRCYVMLLAEAAGLQVLTEEDIPVPYRDVLPLSRLCVGGALLF